MRLVGVSSRRAREQTLSTPSDRMTLMRLRLLLSLLLGLVVVVAVATIGWGMAGLRAATGPCPGTTAGATQYVLCAGRDGTYTSVPPATPVKPQLAVR